MPEALANGVRLHYERTGEGPTVLLVPGLGADTRLFARVTAALSASCDVVCFDPRGAGSSEKPCHPYSMGDMADDAAALLDGLAIPACTVVGYSMGGRIALALALRRPDLVSHLVLAATSARTPPVRALSRRWLATEVLGRVPLPRSLDPQGRPDFERQRRASAAFDASGRLGELRVPTVVLHGTRDAMVPSALARELADGIAGARLVTVPGGHFSLLMGQRDVLVRETARLAGAVDPRG